MHAGYVAGRYRDGSWSDHWTDVARCAIATFTAFRPACRCGWSGPLVAPNVSGHAVAVRLGHKHVRPAVLTRCA